MTGNQTGHPAPGGGRSKTERHDRLRAHYRRLILWTLQAWLTMFYLGAGYAKLTQPMDLLTVLMTWPGLVDPVTVRLLGALDIILACCFIAPLFSSASRSPPRGTLMTIMAVSLFFLIFHISERNVSLALTNAVLIASAGMILFHRARRAPAQEDRR